MLPSANDAAMTIAEGVGGSRSEFVDSMNAKAERARAGGHELRQPDRARRPGQLLDGAATWRWPRASCCATRRWPRSSTRRAPRSRPAPQAAHGHQPQPAGRPVSVGDGVKTGRTPHAGYVLVGSATRGGVRSSRWSPASRASPPATPTRSRSCATAIGQFRRARVVDRASGSASRRSKYHEDDRVDIVPARDYVADHPPRRAGEARSSRRRTSSRARCRAASEVGVDAGLVPRQGRAADPAGHRRAGPRGHHVGQGDLWGRRERRQR